MKLYLCRHAAAEESAVGGDSRRALTTEGRMDFARVAAGLAALEPRIDFIFTSPYLRARQTAEILSEALRRQVVGTNGGEIPILHAAELACGGKPELLLARLRAEKRRPREIMAVGHEPALSSFLGQLCFGKVGRVRFKKGAIACVEMAEALTHGDLVFLMQPGQLTALALA